MTATHPRSATDRLAAVSAQLQDIPRPALEPRQCSDVHIHQLNPTYFLPRAAEIEPNATAIVHLSRTGTRVRFTYRQFSTRVVGLASYFQARGLKRIAVLASNTPAHLETMYAGNAAGGIIMGLNYRLSKEEINYMLDLGEADCIIVDSELVDLIDTHPGRHIIVDQDDFSAGAQCQYSAAINEGLTIARQNLGFEVGDSSRSVHDDWAHMYAHSVDENSVLGLFFTSGTTGRPKAVEYTHRGVYLCAMTNIIESGLNSQAAFGGEDRCRYLWTLPLFHAAGWVYPYAVTAIRGTHYLLRKIEVDRVWDLLINEKVTHFNAAPTVNIMLLNSPRARKLDHPAKVTVAASPPSAQLFKDMVAHNLIPVHVYGLTETYGPFTRSYFKEEWGELSDDDKLSRLAGQGHAFLASDRARVVREDLTDVAADGKEIGEIVVKGNAVTRGYYRNPEETTKSYNQWFRTGDLAVLRPDGSLQIQDRKKDVIISGGENISSVFVESEIARHDAVLESAVVGQPHKLYGEVPIAFVVLKQGHQLDSEQLIEWLLSRIGRYQVPRTVEFVPELPKTSTGKVRKNVLRDRLSKQ